MRTDKTWEEYSTSEKRVHLRQEVATYTELIKLLQIGEQKSPGKYTAKLSEAYAGLDESQSQLRELANEY